ncbi:MAG TPA: GvpL/GvpF family gas vesicle protein [Terriglobales bacterium]|nr:GvpL/GvpF family gas vesicle protein [Terriglobales bacterium]
MPILVYCVTKAGAAADVSPIGVADLPVFRWAFSQVDLFASRAPDPAVWLKRELRTSALEFHRVLRQIFEASAIVPFRYPTIFETGEQLEEHIQQRSGEYVTLLDRFADTVQMEIRISGAASSPRGQSGKDYLKVRQQSIQAGERFASQLKEDLSSVLQEWRQRTARNELRAFALIPRNKTEQFEKAAGAIVVPQGLHARVSGPWPVSEFIEQP